MARELKMPEWLAQRDHFGFLDDFDWLVTAHRWTTLAADAGSTAFAQSDAAGGILTGATGATDNNEIAVRTTNELFLIAANRPALWETRLQYAEAATNAANIAFGVGNAIGANWLVDDGAGPRTSGNQILIYKVDGETVWRAQARNGTGVTTSQSTTTAGGTGYQILRIEVKDMNTTQMAVTYSVDGVRLKDVNTGLDIVHFLNIASSTEMNVGVYAKAGSGTTETLNVDYIGAYQVRY